jgi:hypothetical protein
MRVAGLLLIVLALVVVPAAVLVLHDPPAATQPDSAGTAVAHAYREMQSQGYSNIICEPVGINGASCSATRPNGSGIVVGFGSDAGG